MMTKNKTLKKRVNPFGKNGLRKLGFLLTFSILGCVTVHVNFPESAVQRAADDFVRDIYKGTTEVAGANTPSAEEEAAEVKKTVLKAKTPSKSKKSGKLPASNHPKKNNNDSSRVEPTRSIFNFFIRSAYADGLKFSSSAAKKLQEKMKARAPEILALQKAGVVCESSDGKLKAINLAKAKDPAHEIGRAHV